jgi:hypothetical protein
MKVLLLACALAVSACLAGAVFAAEPFSEPSQLDQLQAGYHRLKIGTINVIAVSDGAATFDVLGVIPKEKRRLQKEFWLNRSSNHPSWHR